MNREKCIILIFCFLSLSLVFFASQIRNATASDYCSTLLSTYTITDWYNAATEQADSTITYAFPPTIDPNTGDGIRCTWKSTSGFGQSERTGAFSVTGPGNLTAIYQAQYQLTYSVNPTSGGSISLNPADPGNGWYDSDTMVSLTADPANGYVFSSWSDGGAQSHSITMSQATTLTANFAREVDHFTFETIPSPQTAGSPFAITITAVDADGNTVSSYSGLNTLSDTTGTITPTMTASFISGVWTGSVTITYNQTGVSITTSGAGKIGESNLFDVVGTASESSSFDFTVTASPINEQVGRESSLSISVAVLLLRGTGEEIVNLTVSGAPPTMQTSFDVQSGTPTFTSTLIITPDTTTPLGQYVLTIYGTTSGGLTRSAMLDIEVARQTPNDFTVRINPPGAVIVPGNSTVTVTVTVFRGGYTGPVTLSYSGSSGWHFSELHA